MEQKNSEKIMIDVQDVSMRFMMSNDKIGSLKEMVTQLIRGKIQFKEFWALRDVSFHVEKAR